MLARKGRGQRPRLTGALVDQSMEEGEEPEEASEGEPDANDNASDNALEVASDCIEPEFGAIKGYNKRRFEERMSPWKLLSRVAKTVPAKRGTAYH